MAQPSGRELRVDAINTALLVGYKNLSYIADLFLPFLRTTKQSGILPQLLQSYFFRNLAKKRAPGTKSLGSGFGTDLTMTYFCQRASFRAEITDEDRDNSSEPFKLDQLHSQRAMDLVMLEREVAAATDLFTTGKWGADKVGNTDFTKWSDYAGGLPLVDLATYQDDIEAKVGVEGDTLVIGKQVWVKLKWNPQLVDSIKYTQRAQVSLQLAAELMELRRILVGRAIYTTDPEGTAEANVTYTRIWGKHGLLLHSPDSVEGAPHPPAGVTVVWERVPNALGYIKRMRDEEREVDIFEANSYYQHKIVEKRSGIFLQNAVA